MNRKALLVSVLCFLFVLNVNCSAQKEVRVGRYSNNSGTTLVINDSHIIILSREPDRCVIESGRITDTIAVCSWTRVAENFIRIDSKSPYELVQDSYYSHKGFNPLLDRDSINIHFSLPIDKIPVEIQVYDFNTAGRRFNKSFFYSKNNEELTSCDSVLVCIKPLYRPLNVALFDGILEPVLLPPEFTLPYFLIATNGGQWNTVDISIPCLNDSFFERVWIIGEYIQVTEKGLIWHGNLFSPRIGG